MEMKICQSCGMPMAEGTDLFGTNADGSLSETYCKYCFSEGAFGRPNETMEEMIDTCVPFMVEGGMTAEAARTLMEETLPKLERWRNTI